MAPSLTTYLKNSIILFSALTLLLFVHHEIQIFRNPGSYTKERQKLDSKAQIQTEQSKGKTALVKRKELLEQQKEALQKKELVRGPLVPVVPPAPVTKPVTKTPVATQPPNPNPKPKPKPKPKPTSVAAHTEAKLVVGNTPKHAEEAKEESSSEEVERRGDLVCDGKKIDHEVIYWKVVPGDSTYESPVTPHHGEHENKYLTFEYDGGGWNNIRMGMVRLHRLTYFFVWPLSLSPPSCRLLLFCFLVNQI